MCFGNRESSAINPVASPGARIAFASGRSSTASRVVLAGAAGVWLFYVQHQFESTYWAKSGAWNVERSAIVGSSYYDLPAILHWFSGNIGYHHLHHLASRVPNYRLRECFNSHPRLQRAQRLSLWTSLRAARLRLWDEQAQRLVPFSALVTARNPLSYSANGTDK